MNVFGDINRFAISVQLNDDCLGHFLLGRFCLHVSGATLGNPSREEYLYIVLNDFEEWLSSAGHRRNEWLMSLEPESFVATVGAGLFMVDHPEKDIIEAKADSECWYHLDVRPSLRPFFDAWMFLVEGEKNARLIYSGKDISPICEYQLEPGEFDKVVLQAANYLRPVAAFELAKEKKRQSEPLAE